MQADTQIMCCIAAAEPANIFLAAARPPWPKPIQLPKYLNNAASANSGSTTARPSSLKGVQIVEATEIEGFDVVEELTTGCAISNTTGCAISITTGCAISVVGEVVELPAKGQSVELRAKTVESVGACHAETYPL